LSLDHVGTLPRGGPPPGLGLGLAEWRRWLTADAAACALILGVAVLALATFEDYGVTWDEDLHFAYGYKVLDYYLSFFQDRSCLDYYNLHTYGAAFDMIAAALARLSPLDPYDTRHLWNVVTGLLTIVGAWKAARFVGGPRAGFWAALLLVLMPNFYGHMFNNPKDIPLAGAMIWTAYYTLRMMRTAPRIAWADALKAGLAAGLGMGVRVGGVLALCYLGAGLVMALAAKGDRRHPAALARDAVGTLLRAFPLAVAVAVPVMLFFWPWAQQAPLTRPIAAFVEFSHHAFPYTTLFDGSYVPAENLPAAYLPVYILLKLPELVLLLLVAAPLGAFLALRRKAAPVRWAEAGFLALLVVFPVAYAVATKAVLFDGMRHFLFVLPPIAVVAGLVLAVLVERLRAPLPRRAFQAALGVYLAYHASIMVRLHPDQYVYYNALVGGVPGAAGRFLLDYWATSYEEAVDGLEAWLKQHDPANAARHQYRVAVCGPPGSAVPFFPKNFVYEANRDRADFYIAYTRHACDRSIKGGTVYRVERLGTLLSVVLDLRARNQPTLSATSPH
jgi:hypothetical protein